MACPRAPVAALPITLGIVAVNKPPEDKTSSERRRQNKQKTGRTTYMGSEIAVGMRNVLRTY